MRCLMRVAPLLVPLLLAACGSAPTASLSVTCDGQLVLAGAASIESHGDVMTFPDPANPGQTNTISLADGKRCTIKPVLDNSGGASQN